MADITELPEEISNDDAYITELPEEISNYNADIESVDDNKHLLKKQETIKPKRVLSEKQKEALAKGRAKGLEKLKARGELSKQKTIVNKELEKIVKEKNVKDVEDLKKVADLSNVYSKVDLLNNRFNEFDSKISELLSLKKKKHSEEYKRALQEQIKKDTRGEIIKKKTEVYNPWMGKI